MCGRIELPQWSGCRLFSGRRVESHARGSVQLHPAHGSDAAVLLTQTPKYQSREPRNRTVSRWFHGGFDPSGLRDGESGGNAGPSRTYGTGFLLSVFRSGPQHRDENRTASDPAGGPECAADQVGIIWLHTVR